MVVVLAATAVLPLLPIDLWWVRIGDFPRVQLAVGYAIGVGLLMPVRRRRWGQVGIVTLLLGVALQVYWVFAWLPFAPNEVEDALSEDPQRRIRVLSANVLQKNDNAAQLLKIIKDARPNLIVLCEVNGRWEKDLASLKVRYPFYHVHALENKYGMAMFSDLPVSEIAVRHLIRPKVPSLHFQLTLPTGGITQVMAVHPNPPRPGQGTQARDAELVLVGKIAREHRNCIVLGDMNDVCWSRTTNLFQEVSGLLDPRKGRGLFPTFDVHSAIWRYPIDHVFHSPTFRVSEIRTLDAFGSDHFPLLVELSHEPDAVDEQKAPVLDKGDREDAQDVIRQGASAGGS